MKREDIKKYFPDATEEQLKGLLDINSADIGKAKGDFDKVKADLDKANSTIKEYETTISELKKSAEDNEDFKKKFEELEQKIADEKAEAEKKAKEEAEEAALAERFKTVVGENKWRDELTEKMRAAMSDSMQKLSGDIAVQNGGNTSYTTNNTTTTEGDLVVNIEKVVNEGEGTVASMMEEFEFLRRQKAMAKGGA